MLLSSDLLHLPPPHELHEGPLDVSPGFLEFSRVAGQNDYIDCDDPYTKRFFIRVKTVKREDNISFSRLAWERDM